MKLIKENFSFLKSRKTKYLVSFLLAVIFIIITIGVAFPEKKFEEGTVVGGGCKYRRYSGVATVTSIEFRNSHSFKNADTEDMSITFSFKPNAQIFSSWLDSKDTQNGMLGEIYSVNSEPITKNFIQKKEIKVGSEFKVYVDIIETGMCTPIIFHYSTEVE